MDGSSNDPSTPKLLGPDMSRSGWLGEVARHDPRLAVALLGGVSADAEFIRPDLLGWGDPTCGWGWEILKLTGTFETGAANTEVEGQLDGIVEADLWVRKVVYTVKRPNAFANSIFKAQSDFFNAKNPNIDFTLTIKSHCRYLISPDPTPLENIENTFECVCPVGFVLGCSAQIRATFVNTREFVGTSGQVVVGEIPTIAVITMHCVRLPTRYDSCALDTAVKALVSAGYLNPTPKQLA